MRKALVIITAVALLGIAAAYVRPAGGSATSSDSSTAATTELTPTTGSSASKSTGSSSQSSSSASDASSSTLAATGSYQDGTYQGTDARNRYGDVQVSVTIAGGKITAVKYDQLDANDQHSRQINSYASSKLVSQTIAAQGADISGVSGATYTSDSYIQSLQAALDKAQA